MTSVRGRLCPAWVMLRKRLRRRVTALSEGKMFQYRFQLLFYPLSDPLTQITGLNHKVINITDQTGVGPLERSFFLSVKGPVQLLEVKVRQQGRNDPSLRCFFPGSFSAGGSPSFHNWRLQPHPNQFQNRSVRYASFNYSRNCQPFGVPRQSRGFNLRKLIKAFIFRPPRR
jgi:hypothetical protein